MIKLKNLLNEQQNHTGPVTDHTQITNHPEIKNKLESLQTIMSHNFDKYKIAHNSGPHVNAHEWFEDTYHDDDGHNPFHIKIHNNELHLEYIKGSTTFMINIPKLKSDSHGGHSDATAYHDPTHGNVSVGAKFSLDSLRKHKK